MTQNYTEYVRRLRGYAPLADVAEYGRVLEGGVEYPLLRLTVPGERWLIITAGFHGEEPAGPLTLARSFEEIAAYARERGVGLRVYPCINPSGFEDGTRYNRSGERMNNDFLRYETAPGVWKDKLGRDEPFLRWVLYDSGPKETRAVRTDLVRFPPPVAALDIHQDDFLLVSVHTTYAYTFGDNAHYRPLVEQSAAHAHVMRSDKVDEGTWSDADGLVHLHDGSVTDYFDRRGVPFTATLETTTRTPPEDSHAINLLWIRGFIDLAARGSCAP